MQESNATEHCETTWSTPLKTAEHWPILVWVC